MSRQYEISDAAKEQAGELFQSDAEGRVLRMARRAARFTHELANYRFEDYVLRIKDNVIEAIYRYDPDTRSIRSARVRGLQPVI